MLRLAKLPLLSIILVLYNVLHVMLRSELPLFLSNELVGGFLFSGIYFSLTIEDSFVMISICLLFFEILKSGRNSKAAAVEHVFSVFVFLAFMLEFLLIQNFGTPQFLMITLLALVDVLAGFSTTIASSRRDINVN